MSGEVSSTGPEVGAAGAGAAGSGESLAELTEMIHSVLTTTQERFQAMSDQIVKRIDDMGKRIDDLEGNINQLMTQVGAPDQEPPRPGQPSG